MRTAQKVKNQGRKQNRHGMTLVEVLVAVTILTIALPGLLYGVLGGIHLNYSASQHAAAFNLCFDLLEQMRGAPNYDYLTATNYPLTTVRLTHLGGSRRVALNGRRSCAITDRTNPTRKEINIRVDWVYLGKPMSEILDAVIFRRQ